MSKEELAIQGSTTDLTSTGYVTIHPLDPEDAAITAAMRAMVSSSKGARPGIEARGQFDALMESVLPRDDVTFEADTLGGVPASQASPRCACRRAESSFGLKACTVQALEGLPSRQVGDRRKQSRVTDRS